MNSKKAQKKLRKKIKSIQAEFRGQITNFN